VRGHPAGDDHPVPHQQSPRLLSIEVCMQATQSQAAYVPRTHAWSEYLSNRAGDWLRLVLLFVASIIILAPVLWTVSTSLRTPAESFSVPPQWIALRPDFTNYFEVFKRVPFAGYVVNSFIVTGAVVLGP